MVLGAALLTLGCDNTQGSGNPNYTGLTQADIDKQKAEIDANESMPPQAKAMAKAMLDRNGTGQKEMPGKN